MLRFLGLPWLYRRPINGSRSAPHGSNGFACSAGHKFDWTHLSVGACAAIHIACDANALFRAAGQFSATNILEPEIFISGER